jgi:transposase
LFAALNILDGTAIGRCMKRHCHSEFIRFLNAAERALPARKVIHAIVDNYAAHKQPNVLKWLAGHPRWTFHFTPTSASWLNAVEGFFSAITRCQIRRRAFHSVDDLQNAINATSTPTTAIVGRSYEPLPPKRSSKNSLRSLYLLSESVRWLGTGARARAQRIVLVCSRSPLVLLCHKHLR